MVLEARASAWAERMRSRAKREAGFRKVPVCMEQMRSMKSRQGCNKQSKRGRTFPAALWKSGRVCSGEPPPPSHYGEHTTHGEMVGKVLTSHLHVQTRSRLQLPYVRARVA